MTTQEKKEALQDMHQYLSCFHKDTYGYRPRGARAEYLFGLSYDELKAEFDSWEEMNKREEAYEKQREQAAIEEFNQKLAQVIEMGANDRKTAIRWMFGEEEILNPLDIDWIVMQLGFRYTPEGKELVEDLNVMMEEKYKKTA